METRQRILEAAEEVLRQQGYARTTTKEIARQAGVSEGTLYNHFGNKADLISAVFRERQPLLVGLLVSLPERVGTGELAATLHEVADTALRFYRMALPTIATHLVDLSLLKRHREALATDDRGPHRANLALAAYLASEQQHGRIAGDASPESIADVLLGACFQRACFQLLSGETDQPLEDESFIRSLLALLQTHLTGG